MTRLLHRALQRILLLVFVVAYVSFGKATAQERLGNVTGQLLDQSGGGLARAAVILRNAVTGRVTTVESDNAGRYAAHVEPGIMTFGSRPTDSGRKTWLTSRFNSVAR